MFKKHVSELTYHDIDDLVNLRHEQEGYHLDYKKEVGNPDRAKKKLAEDFSAFANAHGGFLVFGVTDSYQIVGIESLIGNQNVAGWLNQVVSSNVVPIVKYFESKIIPIPDSDKVLCVVHIPESTNKPHMVVEGSTYYIRVNDSNKPANHYQVSDMFEFSRRRMDAFQDFLRKRNLDDVESNKFGVRLRAFPILNHVQVKGGTQKPFVLFTVVPKDLTSRVIDPLRANFKTEYLRLATVEVQSKRANVFNGYDNRITADGIVTFGDYERDGKAYFEIYDNGVFESFITYQNILAYNETDVCLLIDDFVFYEIAFLTFARGFLTTFGIHDEVYFQVSLCDILGAELESNHFRFRPGGRPTNQHYRNLKLEGRFTAKQLTEEFIISIVKEHSQIICRAFGSETNYGFEGDKPAISKVHWR